MTTVAPSTALDLEAPEDGVLALDAGVLPLLPARLPDLRPAEFRAFVEEVAVRVSVALDLTGLDAQYEVSTEVSDSGGAPEGERAVFFEDGEGEQLPVYVSCGADGLAFVAVGREDGEVLVVSGPYRADGLDALVASVAAAIEREVPRPTFH